uniref:Uncharacterized protein n=1 Tax=Amphilophus citrinellus TaxID=61819 RepID=A0A3Q0QRZ8_AMPCI
LHHKLPSLGCQFLGLCLLQLSDALTVTHLLISVIVVGLDGFHELGKCTFVLTREKQPVSTVLTLYTEDYIFKTQSTQCACLTVLLQIPTKFDT